MNSWVKVVGKEDTHTGSEYQSMGYSSITEEKCAFTMERFGGPSLDQVVKLGINIHEVTYHVTGGRRMTTASLWCPCWKGMTWICLWANRWPWGKPNSQMQFFFVCVDLSQPNPGLFKFLFSSSLQESRHCCRKEFQPEGIMLSWQHRTGREKRPLLWRSSHPHAPILSPAIKVKICSFQKNRNKLHLFHYSLYRSIHFSKIWCLLKI